MAALAKTNQQIRAIYGLAGKLGMDLELLHDTVFGLTKRKSLADLTKAEATLVVKTLLKHANPNALRKEKGNVIYLVTRDQIEKINQDTLSLENPIGSDDDDRSTLGDFIADDKIPSPVQESSERILAEQVRDILDDLSPKERKILEMRHGLLDGVYHTLEEVGKEFGVTRERIRQIEAKALEKIRTHEKARRLKSY